jgi:O-acetyl-ADP-ribose deacetylase (regulator of RNase III)
MQRKEVVGNILTYVKKSDRQGPIIMLQGCNCFNTMGAGLAGQIFEDEAFELVVRADTHSDYGNRDKLGNFTIGKIRTNSNYVRYCANLYTQYKPGRNFEMDALKKSIAALKSYLQTKHIHHVEFVFPAIGAGIGGGNWDEIYPYLKKEFQRYDYTYVQYNLINPHDTIRKI